MQHIAKVVLENTARCFDKEYSYLIPFEMQNSILKGSKVMVPFGSKDKLREAIVINTIYGEEPFELKYIKQIIDINAVSPSALVDLAGWMKRRYICTWWDALRCIMPPVSVTSSKTKTLKAISLAISEDEAAILLQTGELRTIQQIRVVETLIENPQILVSDLAFLTSVGSSVIKTLVKKGIISIYDLEIMRQPMKNICPEPTLPLKPTPQQENALEMLKASVTRSEFSEVLLHGITGSGKTEVYLQLMDFCMRMGKTAIMLVPEIALTPQMVERLRGRFGDNVAVIHSRLSVGERFDQWKAVKSGKIKVVIGARSAVFAPIENIGMIVIDEEHEASYKSEKNPKYHTVEIARWRSKKEKALLLLGSATPSTDVYYKAINGKIDLIKMTERANKLSLPAVTIVDMKKELEDGNRSVLSIKLQEEISKNISDSKQTILFLNRRGFASFVLCRSCSFVPRCRNCNINLTYHLGEKRLVCHYCGHAEMVPNTCPICESQDIRHFGAGTQRIEDEVKKKFVSSSVIRMDSDTTGFKNAFEELLRKFREEKTDIMVGTQMIAKGHDFPDVTLVGVMAADSMLYSNDFRASERTFQLLTQVAGRAGRGNTAGRVIVQAYSTDDFSITYASKQDYEGFFKNELMLRQKQNYPPFSNIGVIFLSGQNEKEVSRKTFQIHSKLLASGFGTDNCDELLNPSKAPLTKIRGKFRYRLILKARRLAYLIEVLTEISDSFYNEKDRNGIELGVDINPFNMS